jgi:hypothetical protein
MNDEIEEKIEQEIVRRALKRSYLRKKEKEKRLYAKDVLDVLEEMTDLPGDELLEIAEEVKTAYADDGEGFFSIRYQLIFVGLPMLTLFGIPILAVWLL